jgi:hypothetical protein
VPAVPACVVAPARLRTIDIHRERYLIGWAARLLGWTTAADVLLVLLCVIAAAISLLVQSPPASKASAG